MRKALLGHAGCFFRIIRWLFYSFVDAGHNNSVFFTCQGVGIVFFTKKKVFKKRGYLSGGEM
ncbi:MAG: hypothetical protein D3910_29225 [Candidatus Electrothrix sp. ATG2]|nr:hypothetical protein [Candidatus Electrothrix sp. ATG2]